MTTIEAGMAIDGTTVYSYEVPLFSEKGSDINCEQIVMREGFILQSLDELVEEEGKRSAAKPVEEQMSTELYTSSFPFRGRLLAQLPGGLLADSLLLSHLH